MEVVYLHLLSMGILPYQLMILILVGDNISIIF